MSLRRTTSLGVAALVLGALAACGGSDHNDADVAFAQEMIPHHAQAVAMANMTIGRDGLDPEVADLAEQIREAQQPEIDTMSGWLETWDEKVPHTGFASGDGHTHSEDGMGMEGMDGEGMMSADEMKSLQDAQGSAFQERWLELMVEHHRGAVQMAEKEAEDGEFPAATELADGIVRSQRREISTMEDLLRQ